MGEIEDGKIFQEVDLITVLREVATQNRVLQAKVLQEVEKYVTNNEDFSQLRKFILDEQNSYTRKVIKLIFGDIEFLHLSKR